MTRKYGDICIKNKTLVKVCIKSITAFMSFFFFNKAHDTEYFQSKCTMMLSSNDFFLTKNNEQAKLQVN